MFALVLAASLATSLATAPQSPEEMIRGVLTDVCLPYVAGEDAQGPLDFMGFIGPAGGAERELQTEDSAYILRLTSSGSDEGDRRRTCVLVPRRGGLEAARTAVRRPLEAAGFVADADQPADRPVWTRGGVTVSLRQNEGRSPVMRVTYSDLDAAGG